MFVRLVYESFRRQTRRKFLVALAVALGATVSTAMIGIAVDRTFNAPGDNRDLGVVLIGVGFQE